MTDQTEPLPEGPEYTPCACSHIEPEHEPNAGECYSCDCAAYRPTPAVSLPPADQPTPSRRAGLRDEIAAAVVRLHESGGLYALDAGEDGRIADAVLAVLYREWPWLRAEAEDAAPADQTALPVAEAVLAAVEAALCDELVPAARAEALAGIAAVLPATADRRSVLNEAADRAEIVALRLRLKHDVGAANGAYEVMTELRRMADETPAAETQAHVCKPDAIAYYCPTSGETESNCHSGFDACCDRPDLHQPATGARQDGVQ